MPDSYEDLRHDDGSPDPWKVAEEFWPYDGPHRAGATEAAAQVIAQLVRYLNNATFHEHAVPRAPSLYRVVSSLGSAAFGMEQLAVQLAARAEQFARDETLYDDRGKAQSASTTALALADELGEEAKAAAVALGRSLQIATSHAGHLGHGS